MFPLFLHCEKGFGVSRRDGFLHLCQGLPQFLAGVGYQGFEGTLVNHGDDAALDSATQQFAAPEAFPGVVQAGLPALGLGFYVGE